MVINGKVFSFADEMMGDIDEEEPMSMLDDEESEEAVMEKMDHESTEHGHTSNLMLRNGHISLFGEIIHDTEAMISDDLIPPPVRDNTQENVRKNFKSILFEIFYLQ